VILAAEVLSSAGMKTTVHAAHVRKTQKLPQVIDSEGFYKVIIDICAELVLLLSVEDISREMFLLAQMREGSVWQR
jgi:hypothetical protein